MTPTEIIGKFWDEYKDFSQKLGYFLKPGEWFTRDFMLDLLHCWHEKYSKPYIVVLRMIACCTSLKNFGICSPERNWGNVEHIKSGKRIHIFSVN